MEATLRLSRRASYADYLAAEQGSDRRHEFIDGVIVAMAGGSDEHNAIAGSLAGLLRNRRTGACRYYTSDQRFWIASRGRGRYEDGSIICGAPDHPVHDEQATTNPTVVIEVLSPSSEGDDDGDKRSDFQSLPSVEAYVLVAQDQRRVKVYRRAGADWRATTYRDGESFELPTLSTSIPVADDQPRPSGRPGTEATSSSAIAALAMFTAAAPGRRWRAACLVGATAPVPRPAAELPRARTGVAAPAQRSEPDAAVELRSRQPTSGQLSCTAAAAGGLHREVTARRDVRLVASVIGTIAASHRQ